MASLVSSFSRTRGTRAEYYVRFQAAGILTTGFYLVVLYIIEATICAAFTQMQQTISRRSFVHLSN